MNDDDRDAILGCVFLVLWLLAMAFLFGFGYALGKSLFQ